MNILIKECIDAFMMYDRIYIYDTKTKLNDSKRYEI